MHPLPRDIHPPVREDEHGETRRVGVEIELTGLDVETIADTVADVFGGDVTRETDYMARVATPLGAFRVEADLELLQKIGRKREEAGDGGVVAAMRDAVASVAEHVAPFEVVTPPLPYPVIERTDELVQALAERGARGTDAGLLLALGLHLNPQVPRLSADSIHQHVRAYALLEPWLRMRRGVDLSRRFTPFVDPYPPSYVEHLIDRDAPPTMAQLIDDYLRFNPTRNRSLDLLPLFAHLDEDKVRGAVPDRRVKSRPTFHYRLPDSRVGDPDWRMLDEWRHWLVIERVAARPDLLDALISAYREVMRGTRGGAAADAWAGECEEVLAAASFGVRPRAERAA